MTSEAEESAAATTRRLMRAVARGALGTVLRGTEGQPYVSLVLVASDHDGAPILLLSDLADHSKNLTGDDRASLLLDGSGERGDPLAGARLTLQGRLGKCADERLRARYLARHPSAEMYVDFSDFAFYRLVVERAHLVAGFGRIHWLDAADILVEPTAGLIEREAEIIDHMNQDHADALQLYAQRLLGLAGDGWRLTGIDREGCDLRLEHRTARLSFDRPVADAESVRAELVSLAKRARAMPPSRQPS